MESQLPSDEASPLLDTSAIDARDAFHRSNHLVWRIAAAMYSFVVLGFFTSSVGVMLRPISQHYSLNDLKVSLIFVVGPAGYVIAAQSSNAIHGGWGQRGIAFLAPILHILSAGVIAVHPPFGIVLVAFAAQYMGTGLLDGSWCAWAGSMSNANTISGFLHGSFSVGAAAGPFLASIIMSVGHKPWFYWYFVLIAASVMELIILLSAFRHQNAARYRRGKPVDRASTRSNSNTRAIFNHLGTWLCALYFLAYVGTETAISGWVVSFMVRSRNATPYLASLASSGFWAGMALGRFALGAVTDRLGVGRATIIYFICTIFTQVLFSIVRLPVASIAFMAMVGFFMGPMFPSGVVVLTRLIPKELHIPAVSFVASVGQVGAALLPFGIGAVIQGLGISIFRYAIIVLSTIALLVWIAFSYLRIITNNFA
ncbi:MFS transporter-like protein [Lojkania enalia]|uniref:MFS transporter-like protein n=1 Tax=Lojkania enalia TaxID=147567 RepID=A0A9P4K176_9PLEO|nr:MFS transporter-like protein [Didymosphaeria enalia]